MNTWIGGDDFYPTPSKIIDVMLEGINIERVSAVLEPSAGSGNIVKGYKEKYKNVVGANTDIDCVEINPRLQSLLRGEGHKVIHDDFLTFNTFKKYDLILMNPPFSEGDKHLLKALEMQRRGGSVVCLLNAETLKNPYTNTRKQLVKLLEKLGATIQYIKDAFSDAERKTDVEVAIVKIFIPHQEDDSEIYERMRKEHGQNIPEDFEPTEMAVTDYLAAIIAQFNVEIATCEELIRQYHGMSKYILKDAQSKYAEPILKLEMGEHSNNHVTINNCLKAVRVKYWRALLANPKFTGKMTNNLQEKYRGMVDKLKDYDFTLFNIEVLTTQMNAELYDGVKAAIIEMFDRLTVNHAYYPECKNNIHYFDGWKTNKAHKVNKKVIIPCHGVFWEKYMGGSFRPYEAVKVLADIEKIFNFFDGTLTAQCNVASIIENETEKGKYSNIKCKYFTASFYKKGTCHLTFANTELLERFNIYAAKNKAWLPPNYGTTPYSKLQKEERAVVDSFQGKVMYDAVMKNQRYYLPNERQLLLSK